MKERKFTIRLDEDLDHKLTFIKDGLRGEAIRCLLRLIIDTQLTNVNTYVVDDLLNNRLVLVRRDQLTPEIQEIYENVKAAE